MVALAKSKTFDEWRAEMEKICLKKTGCTWDDLAGDLEPLQDAYDTSQTPEEFIDWLIRKFDLDDLTQSPGFGL